MTKLSASRTVVCSTSSPINFVSLICLFVTALAVTSATTGRSYRRRWSSWLKFPLPLLTCSKTEYWDYVEIKCQLFATDDIYCRFYCMLNMFRAILCPSSGAREYYTDGRCLWYLVLWFSGCRYGVELKVMCPVRSLQTGHIIFSSTPYRQPENQNTKYHRQRPSA